MRGTILALQVSLASLAVIDGNTLHDNGRNQDYRLFGIDASETTLAKCETEHRLHRATVRRPRRLPSRWGRVMSSYRIRIGEEWQLIFVKGRDGWAVLELMGMVEIGCTPIHNPAPRWSGYIHNLRRLGVNIETIHESHRRRLLLGERSAHMA